MHKQSIVNGMLSKEVSVDLEKEMKPVLDIFCMTSLSKTQNYASAAASVSIRTPSYVQFFLLPKLKVPLQTKRDEDVEDSK